MDQRLKIRLEIANRMYPMTIPVSQEEHYRRAAVKIQELIKYYEEKYAVKDKQDALAMCTIQFATQVEHASSSLPSQHESDLEADIVALNNLIERKLSTL